MTAATRVIGFALALGAIFAVAAVAGARLDPDVDTDDGGHAGEMNEMAEHATTAGPLPGLASAQDGYRIIPERSQLDRGAAVDYRFRIVDADGETVRDFDVEHERRMHLIVVRRDFTGFQHLHPRQLGDGSWMAAADLSDGGVYRVFADFSTDDTPLTLATDAFVPGTFEPEPLPAPAGTADAGDGYEVTIDSDTPTAGAITPARFTVTRHGREVGAVQPYLGADGHLVALREHDQAFLHTHPNGEPGGPGPIVFGVEYPTTGRYRLYLQFKHRGEVHTAAFTQEVEEAASEEGDEHVDD